MACYGILSKLPDQLKQSSFSPVSTKENIVAIKQITYITYDKQQFVFPLTDKDTLVGLDE